MTAEFIREQVRYLLGERLLAMAFQEVPRVDRWEGLPRWKRFILRIIKIQRFEWEFCRIYIAWKFSCKDEHDFYLERISQVLREIKPAGLKVEAVLISDGVGL